MKRKKKIKIIVKIAKKMSGLTIKELSGRTKKAEIVAYRNAIMYLLYNECKFTSTKAAQFMQRDHATLLHAIKKVDDALQYPDRIHYPIYVEFFSKFNKKVKKHEEQKSRKIR